MLTGLLFRGYLQTIPNNAMSDRQSTHTLRFYNAIFLVRTFCHREPFNICALSTVWENDGQTNHSLNSKKKEKCACVGMDAAVCISLFVEGALPTNCWCLGGGGYQKCVTQKQRQSDQCLPPESFSLVVLLCVPRAHHLIRTCVCTHRQ